MKPFQRGVLATVSTALFLLPFISPGLAFALPTDADCQSQVIGNIGCVPYFLKNIINAGFILAGIITVVLIILSGIRLLLSGGDPERVEHAKKSLTYAIIGFVIILLSFVIINLIARVTGANI